MDTYCLISEQTKKKLIIVLACALVFSSMSATMFNVALPSITEELSLTASQASWIVTSYMIIYALGAISYGKLADKYTLKNLLTIGLLLFTIGSLVGFFSDNFAFIILARVMQAMGASVFPASAMIIPTRYFSPETRGRALGMTSAGLSLGVAIGPIIAGMMTTALHWHYLFALSVLPVIFIPFFRAYLDNQAGKDMELDLVGAVLLGVTITCLLLGISTKDLYYFPLVIVFLVLLMLRMKLAEEPFIRLELFKNRRYSLILILFALSSGIGFGLPYLTPLLLAEVNGVNAFISGLIMFPGAAIAALLAKRGGELADKKGNSFLGYIALSSYFICFFNLSWIVGHSPYLILIILAFGYIAQSFFQMTLANTVSEVLPKSQIGVGMGLFMLTNFVASSIATALMGTSLSKELVSPRLNIFQVTNKATVYSNIYIVLSIIVIVMFTIYSVMISKSHSHSEMKSKGF